MSYAELVCITNFTFQHGASHGPELVKRAKELGYAALAIVDECSVAGAVRAHEEAKRSELPLIIGSQFRLPGGHRIVLLAPNHDAYTQICGLITRARRAAEKGAYVIAASDFSRGLEHCLAIWLPGAAIDVECLGKFKALPFAGHYIGCVHHLMQDSDRRLQRSMEVADSFDITPLAVGDVHYHERSRRPLHDVLTAIRLGTTVMKIGRQGFSNGERHLRPLTTLRKLFPEVLLANTLKVAEQCKFSLSHLRYQYPNELVPAGSTPAEHLRKLTEEGLRSRWPKGTPESVRTLIEKELALIARLKYEHYFLTVQEIVAFARQQKILCQGRGSAANSAVCYALGVTEVDPEHSNMLFERFISEERSEVPDIDIDFEHQRREEVIQHVYEKYGRERAGLAATVVCYRRRMAVRDVAKALGFAPDVVDALAKSLHWFHGNLPAELQQLGFDPQSRMAQHLLRLVEQILGFPRHLSQHVGGMVISEYPLRTLVPLENAAMPERTIIQWDKEDLESLGLLKVDCLALGMLSAMRRSLDMISAYQGKPFGMENIPKADKPTYDMLCRAEAVGVFQVESRAQMSMLPRLKPRVFYDLVIQIAIVRPGPIQGNMVHPYLRRRQGLEEVSYPSEALKAVLGRTYGVPLFQEQVMQVVIVAAGFTPGEADQVRRSMAAWQRRGGLDHFKDRLMQGMRERGYAQTFAERIFQQILGFGSYGFPESHAASFALLAYNSAWLRCHHPAAFCAGLLNSYPTGFYAPAQLIADAKRNRKPVSFRPADVQFSDYDCTLEPGENGAPEVRIGLRMIKGLGEKEAQAVVRARAEKSFTGITDLAHRSGLKQQALDALARAGALATLSGARPAARWNALGVEQLPGMLAGHSAPETTLCFPPSSEGKELTADYRSLGFTLGRHPMTLLRRRLDRWQVRRAGDLNAIPHGKLVRVAGLVTHRQRPQTAAGIIFVSLEDETGIHNLIVRKHVQHTQRAAVLNARLMVVQGELQNGQGVIHIIARQIRDYSHWLGEMTVHSRDFQ